MLLLKTWHVKFSFLWIGLSSASTLFCSHLQQQRGSWWGWCYLINCHSVWYQTQRWPFFFADLAYKHSKNPEKPSLFVIVQDCRQDSRHRFLPWTCLWHVHTSLIKNEHPWKRCRLEDTIWCSEMPVHFSAWMFSSQMCRWPLPRSLTQPHSTTEPGFFWLVADNSLNGPD